jgi:hypothetical protein
MTNVSEIVDRAVRRGTTTHSSNGGPPSPADETRTLAIAVAVAFLAGVLLARWIDWRTHAHPHH